MSLPKNLGDVYAKSRAMIEVVDNIPNMPEHLKITLHNIIGGTSLIQGIAWQTEFSCRKNELTPYADLNPVQHVDLRPIMNKRFNHEPWRRSAVRPSSSLQQKVQKTSRPTTKKKIR